MSYRRRDGETPDQHGRRVVAYRRERTAREEAQARAFARRRNQGVSVAGERDAAPGAGSAPGAIPRV